MNEYFRHLNNINKKSFIEKMRKYAEENNVPIISNEGLLYLLQIARLIKAKRVLEIGTAIAYTAINIALLDKNIIVDSIERDRKMYLKALENINNINLEKQIKVYNYDALDINLKLLSKKYDIIFIDAAKAQYQKFFEKFENLLNENGIIICDNLLFHGLVESEEEIKSKNLRSLVNKIKKFNEWLANNKKYYTVFMTIGDGMAVSEKI